MRMERRTLHVFTLSELVWNLLYWIGVLLVISFYKYIGGIVCIIYITMTLFMFVCLCVSVWSGSQGWLLGPDDDSPFVETEASRYKVLCICFELRGITYLRAQHGRPSLPAPTTCRCLHPLCQPSRQKKAVGSADVDTRFASPAHQARFTARRLCFARAETAHVP